MYKQSQIAVYQYDNHVRDYWAFLLIQLMRQ